MGSIPSSLSSLSVFSVHRGKWASWASLVGYRSFSSGDAMKGFRFVKCTVSQAWHGVGYVGEMAS